MTRNVCWWRWQLASYKHRTFRRHYASVILAVISSHLCYKHYIRIHHNKQKRPQKCYVISSFGTFYMQFCAKLSLKNDIYFS